MRKLGRVCAVILFFAIFQFNWTSANEISTKNLNHVDVYVNGQVYIDTQINGVSQDYKQTVVNISDISVEIEENGKTKTYTNFTEQTQSGSQEREYHKNVDSFTKDAIITVSGRITSQELNLDMTFSKVYSGDSLLAAVNECPAKSGCDIRITSEEIKNIITYDIIFRTEEGGKFEDDQEHIDYTNIVSGESFPNIPEIIADENYEFLGWYDENANTKIESFPSTVDGDMVVIAKWKLKEQKKDENNNEEPDEKQDEKQDKNEKQNNDELKDNTEEKNIDNENEEKEIDNNKEIVSTENMAETVANINNEDNNIIAEESNDLETLDSYNPPKTAVENNIVLLIVSFIICSTATIYLGSKIKKK